MDKVDQTGFVLLAFVCVVVAGFALIGGAKQVSDNKPRPAVRSTAAKSTDPDPGLILVPNALVPKGYGIPLPGTGTTLAPF